MALDVSILALLNVLSECSFIWNPFHLMLIFVFRSFIQIQISVDGEAGVIGHRVRRRAREGRGTGTACAIHRRRATEPSSAR